MKISGDLRACPRCASSIRGSKPKTNAKTNPHPKIDPDSGAPLRFLGRTPSGKHPNLKSPPLKRASSSQLKEALKIKSGQTE